MASALVRLCVRDTGLLPSTSSSVAFQTAATFFNGGLRNMAVHVNVKDNRIQQALSELNQKREGAGITEELRKRRHYINGSDQKYETNKVSYKHAVGQVVSERIKWVMKRRRQPANN